ncbi:Paired amphipathic helix protein Sin3-like 3 [Cardamine amara subsp. amara]|uniref:Paired amphipathic helix protein Sin3-like 3 n=1 Tax=Cardamine amara subsp. amara TaxID=228776 RepID=A0ABD1BP77_CARAN
MVGRKVPTKSNQDEVLLYFNSVKNAFLDEPARYDEFIKVLNDLRNHRVEIASVLSRAEELLKNHRDLLLGFSVFLPEGAKLTISPEVKRTMPSATAQQNKSYYTKKNRADAENFMNKLKKRFWSLDTHVVRSFRKIMQRFKEGKMSEKKAYKEVINILYYHEDLINEFSRLFTKSDPVATSSLLLQV